MELRTKKTTKKTRITYKANKLRTALPVNDG